MSLITVESLHIYPIKSAMGLSLKSLSVGPSGPKWDRHWMLTEEDGTFITQRSEPQLCQIQTELSETHLVAKHPKHGSVDIPLIDSSPDTLQVTVHGSPALGQKVSGQAHEWFSEFFQRKVWLVRPVESQPRTAPKKYDPLEAKVAFADAFPFLLTSIESLEDFQTKLGRPIGMEHFRPNIVVKGGAAYQEDLWHHLEIGDLSLESLKNCSRCSIITVDPKSGAKDNSVMTTLKSYRKEGQKVIFGQNLSHRNLGSLKVGDVLEVKSLKPILK